jgi:hypothetical protein
LAYEKTGKSTFEEKDCHVVDVNPEEGLGLFLNYENR